ncbi:ornithine cyclodeaminase family protein [Saccharothrix sp. Mg75]|uniref:ornithine cyclodeaminase family protein n=1 Tax=Saccharothrix sp. Mg75 TaxID=3445357 RepID=UPI003EE8FC64
MRNLDGDAVRELLPMSAAIPLMRDALRSFSAGRVNQPVRTVVPGAGGDLLAVMPAFVPFGDGRGVFGVKAIAVKPGNPARCLDPHPGLVLVLDPDTAVPLAVVDGTSLTAIRTAAVSAVATDALARPDAGVLALLGSGTQARAHLTALALVRDLREVRVWSRDPDRARAFAEWAVGHPVVRAASVAEAVAGADLICTTTSSPTPLLGAGEVAAGAHVNAVGAVFPDRRELAGDLVGRARVFVDSRESALVESGDLLSAMAEGHFAASDIRAEIGEVLLGGHPGRGGDDEVTVFESLGLAVEDVVAARYVCERAADLG